MTWFTGGMLYLLIWWLVLFTVLPWRAHPPAEPETGHADSAPANPMMVRKALATTAISAVVWVGCYFLITSDLITFRGAISGG